MSERNIKVLDATEASYTVVQNLIRFYVYDMSEYTGWDFPEHGLIGGVNDQPHYWGRVPKDPDHRWPEGWRGYAFVIRVIGKLAGFALVKQIAEEPIATYDMGEFCVRRKSGAKG